MDATSPTQTDLELVWGASAIARELNLDERQTFHILRAKKLPAKKVGRHWVTSRSALRKFFAELTEVAA